MHFGELENVLNSTAKRLFRIPQEPASVEKASRSHTILLLFRPEERSIIVVYPMIYVHIIQVRSIVSKNSNFRFVYLKKWTRTKVG